MQDRPEAQDLLEAIQDFLLKQILPAVSGNDALAYKTLVSWNMLGVIAREGRNAEAALQAELARLRDLTSSRGENPPTYTEQLKAGRELNRLLAQRIRSEKISDPAHEIWQFLKKTAAEKIATVNPRFAAGE